MKETLPRPCEHGRLKRQCNECDLQAQNDELRAKIELLNETLYLALPYVECYEGDEDFKQQKIRADSNRIRTVLEATPAQSLADIRAESVQEAANAVVRHNECGFCLHCLLIDHANKIKGAE